MTNAEEIAVSLTADERSALAARWNLADAHSRQEMSSNERRHILDQMGEMFVSAGAADYHELEQRSSSAFLASMGQHPRLGRRIAVYSSSVASMIVARMLRRRCAEVQLTCPTFDNVHALLQGEGVKIRPRMMDHAPDAELKTDAVFEVTPNNPTGVFLDADAIRSLAVACASSNKLLILDQSFKGQVREACFDHYAILDESGVSYIVIEDTGKLWPTLDLKVAFLVCSSELLGELEAIVDDVLLNVSPFLLELVARYSHFSLGDKFESIRGLVRRNRAVLRACIAEAPGVSIAYSESAIGVEVLDLHEVTSHEYLARLDRLGVAALDTRKFYWDPEVPAPAQIRLALCREPEYFSAACDRMRALWQGQA